MTDFVIANWDSNRPNSLDVRKNIFDTNVIINSGMEYVSGDSTILLGSSGFRIPAQSNVTIQILPQVKSDIPPGAYKMKLATYDLVGAILEPLILYISPISGSFIVSFRSSRSIQLSLRFTLVDAVTQVELDGIERYVIKISFL